MTTAFEFDCLSKIKNLLTTCCCVVLWKEFWPHIFPNNNNNNDNTQIFHNDDERTIISERTKSQCNCDEERRMTNKNGGSKNNIKNSQPPRLGIQGVKLKKFEEVVCDCIHEVKPNYFPLPNLSKAKTELITSAVKQYQCQCQYRTSKDTSIDRDTGTDTTLLQNEEERHDDDDDDDNGSSSNNNKTNRNTGEIPPCPWPFNILPSAANVRISVDYSTSLKKKSDVNSSSSSTNTNIKRNSVITLGKLSGMRAVRKEWQLRSMIQCLLAMLPPEALGPQSGPESESVTDSESNDNKKENETEERERIKIIDFAGGTGVLALPLALLLPKCEVVVVDLKATSLELIHEKAKELSLSELKFDNDDENEEQQDEQGDTTQEDGRQKKKYTGSDELEDQKSQNSAAGNTYANNTNGNDKKKKHKPPRVKPKGASRDIDVTSHSNTIRQNKYIPNLYTYHGSITTYAKSNSFDIGLSLHCCGEGTDLVLQACGTARAHFIVSPCCVGKLNSQKHNPYVYHATSSNDQTVKYPQSSTFCKLIGESRDKFDALAKAADYSDVQYIRTCRNATRRTAKALLEFDRLLFMKEKFGFDDVVLTRMSPWEASPKNDILLGWFHDNEKSISGPYNNFASVNPCHECNADIEMAVNQLVSAVNPETEEMTVKISEKLTSGDDVDWDKDEIDEYTAILEEFVKSDLSVKRFQTRMGSRKRKLVHYLAQKMNLRHWGEGKKVSEKIVVVGKKSQGE